MHKLLLRVIALALLLSAQRASARPSDSITAVSTGYFTRVYQELRQKQAVATETELALSAMGTLLLVGGTVRMLWPSARKRRAKRRAQYSPQSSTRGGAESSASRSANQRQSASRNSRSS